MCFVLLCYVVFWCCDFIVSISYLPSCMNKMFVALICCLFRRELKDERVLVYLMLRKTNGRRTVMNDGKIDASEWLNK